ncbi:MAG TPA: hypothetical protein VN604_04700 [Nitrospirota bacterium]|nr:hypothetical protein [Nitrospirota bacterium]
MPETVFASQAASLDAVKTNIADCFRKGKYEEISRLIGMHSIMTDPQHTIQDQSQLYRFLLDLIKDRIRTNRGKDFSAWLTSFPKLLAELVASKQVVTDEPSLMVIESHHDGFGPFRSLDEFYFWALDDRRLTVGQIVKYVERTAKR